MSERADGGDAHGQSPFSRCVTMTFTVPGQYRAESCTVWVRMRPVPETGERARCLEERAHEQQPLGYFGKEPLRKENATTTTTHRDFM